MAVLFQLPDVGEGVAEAEVIRWFVREGDMITADQPVVEVQTDKAMVELPAPAAGRVAEIRWREGQVVPVGEVLLVIATGEESSEVPHVFTEPAAVKVDPSPTAESHSKKRRRVPAAPSTRRLARELNIDINQVTGTGPQGRVMDEDVRRFAQEPESFPHGGESDVEDVLASQVVEEIKEEPLSRTRRVIAERLVFSVTKKPHVTHFDELSVDGLVAWREQRKQAGQSFSYLSFLMKAIAVTLSHHPQFNAHFDEEKQRVRSYRSIALGMATDTPRGLLVPVIPGVEQKSIEQLSREIVDRKEAAQQGTIPPDQLQGSTLPLATRDHWAVVGQRRSLILLKWRSLPSIRLSGARLFRKIGLFQDGG